MKHIQLEIPDKVHAALKRRARNLNLDINETINIALYRLFLQQVTDFEMEMYKTYTFLLTEPPKSAILSTVDEATGTATASETQRALADHDPGPDSTDDDSFGNTENEESNPD